LALFGAYISRWGRRRDPIKSHSDTPCEGNESEDENHKFESHHKSQHHHDTGSRHDNSSFRAIPSQYTIIIMDEKKWKKHLKKGSKAFKTACDCWYSQDYEQARILFQECLRIREGLLGKIHPLTARAYYSMGCSLHHEGNYTDALLALRRSMRISTVLNDTTRQAADREYIQWVLQKGNLLTNEQVHEYQHNLEDSIQWEQTGDAAVQQGDTVVAVGAYEESLAIELSAVAGASMRHLDVADLHVKLASLTDRHIHHWENARAIYEAVLGSHHPCTVCTANKKPPSDGIRLLHVHAISSITESFDSEDMGEVPGIPTTSPELWLGEHPRVNNHGEKTDQGIMSSSSRRSSTSATSQSDGESIGAMYTWGKDDDDDSDSLQMKGEEDLGPISMDESPDVDEEASLHSKHKKKKKKSKQKKKGAHDEDGAKVEEKKKKSKDEAVDDDDDGGESTSKEKSKEKKKKKKNEKQEKKKKKTKSEDDSSSEDELGESKSSKKKSKKKEKHR
jgi:hypothetical protein